MNTLPHVQAVLDRLEARGGRVRQVGNGWSARCPAHQDDHPSLSLTIGKSGQLLLTCHAGCSWRHVVKALDLMPPDLYPPKRHNVRSLHTDVPHATPEHPTYGKPEPGNVFAIRNQDGMLEALHVRFDLPDGEKQMPFHRNGKWTLGKKADGRLLKKSDLSLFGAETVASIPSDASLILCEGEKAARAVRENGLHALGTVTGAGGIPCDNSLSILIGRDVILWPDNDGTGRTHMQRIADRLRVLGAKSVRSINWRGAPEKGDAADYFDTGGTVEGLTMLVKECATSSATRDERNENNERSNEDNSSNSFLSSYDTPMYPSPMRDEAFIGLAGDLVRQIAPHSESAHESLLIQFLTAFGNAAGRRGHFTAEADTHFGNLYVVIVAATGARKGTSWGHIRHVMQRVDHGWAEERILGGLSSGEGLIHAVRDKDDDDDDNDSDVPTDKRVLCYEPEFASVLKVLTRDGNTLSAILRQAWDGGTLRVLTKQTPAKASETHISIIGHITSEELTRYLSSTEAGNGFGNRILWICAKRSQMLPEGGSLSDDALTDVVKGIREALVFAAQAGHIKRDAAARAKWAQLYPILSAGRPGLLGAMTARAEAQTMRLALLYAFLDRSDVITVRHLQAAYAVWEYAEASARFVFGTTLGDPMADTILAALKEKGKNGMTRTDISSLFARNRTAREIANAIRALQACGLVEMRLEETNGRTAERCYAVAQNERNERDVGNGGDGEWIR